jgi:hypothetical protein
MLRDTLMDLVILQIKQDVKNEDYTAIEELLKNVSDEQLSGFISEVTFQDINSTGGKW